MEIPSVYRATLSSASTPTPEPSPAGASDPTKTCSYKAAGMHNNILDTNLLIPSRFKLHACCSELLQENTGGAMASDLFPILATLSASLSKFLATVIPSIGTSKSTAPSPLLDVSAYSSSGTVSTCHTNGRLPLPARPPIHPQIPPDFPLQPVTNHLHHNTLTTHIPGSISYNNHHCSPHPHTITSMGSIAGNYLFSITIN